MPFLFFGLARWEIRRSLDNNASKVIAGPSASQAEPRHRRAKRQTSAASSATRKQAPGDQEELDIFAGPVERREGGEDRPHSLMFASFGTLRP